LYAGYDSAHSDLLAFSRPLLFLRIHLTNEGVIGASHQDSRLAAWRDLILSKSQCHSSQLLVSGKLEISGRCFCEEFDSSPNLTEGIS